MGYSPCFVNGRQLLPSLLAATFTALPVLELGKESAGLGNFSLLTAILGVGALVVAAEEQDDLLSMEVDEDPKQHLLGPAIDRGRVA